MIDAVKSLRHGVDTAKQNVCLCAVSLASESSGETRPSFDSGRKHLSFINHKYFWLSSEEVQPENV